MKVCVYSNAPWAPTGYGQQTALLAPLLAERYGPDNVAVAANYGLQGTVQRWQGIRIYPAGRTPFSDDVAAHHCEHFFAGEPGIVLTLFDNWVLKNPAWNTLNVASWVPVDHDPAPPDVLEWFTRTGALPVAMSHFGRDALAAAGLTARYVPHMIDLDVFQPRSDTRRQFGLSDKQFVVGMVAANKGHSPSRKGFPEAFQAFAKFKRIHPDAILWVHSDPYGFFDGVDLEHLARTVGLDDQTVRFTDPYQQQIGFPPARLAELYSTFDVLLAPSYGEGFGIPVIEAQACGVPVIVNDFTAQPELVGAGWTVTGQRWYDAVQRTWFQIPNVDDIVDRLKTACGRSRRQVHRDRISAQAKAADYAIQTVWTDCWQPTLDACEQRYPETTPLSEE